VSGKLCALIAVSLIALGSYGCGSEEQTQELPNARAVPKPSEARTGVVSENTAAYASYEMPRSWSFQQLLDFYDTEMPEGQDWEGWPYCGTRGGNKASDTYLTRLYRTPDNLQLDVSVLWDDTGPVGAIIQRTQLNENPEPC